jgi:hypothetical protein
MSNTRRNFLLGFLLAASSTRVLSGAVVINEIMYHPASEDLLESYVELHNSDAVTANLSGWKFTKGLTYTFPTNTLLAPGAYLVVAADRAAFTNKYPTVANFVAGWQPPLGRHVQLVNPAGQVVSEVQYSNDGDWAARILTTNGFAAYGHFGWEWQAAHDGSGSSLELLNPNLPNSYALNWGSSVAFNGTPGAPNSLFQTNIPPIVTGISHSPAIPQPTDVVTISARLVDEHATGLTATVYYRNASTTNPPAFSAAPMFDDGNHNDGLAADGIFGAQLPAQPTGTVIEFYLQAHDVEGNVRTYPNVVPPTGSLRTANLLYQVDNTTYAGAQPIYRLIMTEMERFELYQLGRGCPGTSPGASMDSDAQMNATWIAADAVLSGGTSTQVRYNAGVRNRGHGTRSSNPNNYHVNIPGDRAWKNLTGINLNSQYAHSQVVGSAVFRRIGVPMAESRPVQLLVNSTNLMGLAGLPDNNSFGSYAANEQYNSDFIQRAFALDPYGNSYRGIRDQTLCDSSRNSVADLSWHGASYAQAAYTNAYFKENNLLQNDWADLIDLIAVLNTANGYAASNYVSDVLRRLNVDEWMKYMAVNTLLDNGETCLANGVGDDYALFRGTNDSRFQALSYDLDTVMGRGLTPSIPRHSLLLMTNLSVMNRFMKTPEFAPVYYRWLKTLAETEFAPAQMNPLLDQLFVGYLPQVNIDNMKAYNAAQVSYVLSQIPLSITISNNLTVQSGYPRTTLSTVTLFGTANAINTRQILVNGTPATWVAWQAAWTSGLVTLNAGINRVLVQALNVDGNEFERSYTDIWYDDGSVQTAGGTIAIDTTWTAAGGPYSVTTSLTIPSGVTLTIQPGTTVYLGPGVNLVVNDGGRLLAEGSPSAPIRFTVTPGSGANWGGLIINGVGNSPETRIAYAHFEGNSSTCIEVAGGTLYLDHTTFGTTTHQYLSLDSSSFLISNCEFPTTTAPFELVHGTGGIKAGGRGIVRDCFFGTTTGYNDIMDFTGGNRDLSQPIIQYYNNVFIGASDDILDLDGTDAWIEGNIFLHVHKNGAPDSSSAVSGGNTGSDTSQITIIGNLFYDCDQAATAKQGNFFTLLNNTMVRMTKQGGLDTADGVVNVRDLDPGPPTTFGAGFYLEGNVVADADQLVRNYDAAQTTVTFNNNILPLAWVGPGTNNLVIDPLLKHIPALAETYFANFQSAQVLRDWFSLRPGSPALGSGPNGRDMGGVVPLGASIAGEPLGTNNQTSATLTVGTVRTGFGIPTTGWPNGSGYTQYKWRLDAGNWSAETAISTAITLTGLPNGPHHLDVVGKRDSGTYQDATELGPDALVTTSRTWVVDTSYVPPSRPTLRLNEILAQNSTTLTNGGTTPDIIELYNYGDAPVDLVGLGLSDNAALPFKYTFPAGTPQLPAKQYLVVFCDSQIAAPGIHLGFSLKANGDDVYLSDQVANGGSRLDFVTFGTQIPDFSIGRGSDGTWLLCQPSIGVKNVALGSGDPRHLKLNEWLTDALFLDNNDFLEIFNPTSLPVALAGCYLSNAEGAPALSPIPPLSFISAAGYLRFVADGDPQQGSDHLAFRLDPSVGIILLSAPDLQPIDIVNYGPQATDVSQGRSPNGSDTLVSFGVPTPGAPNPVPNGVISVTNVTSMMHNLVDIGTTWRYDNSGGTNFGTTWYQVGYNDSAWPQGTGLFGFETTPAEYPFTFPTFIPPPNQAGGKITVYYRTHFQWDGSLTNYGLFSTNYVDDGVVYYLNGSRLADSIRMPASVTYDTFATGTIATEGTPEYLTFTNRLVVGDNVIGAEVHQVNLTSSDDVFGLQLNAVQYITNILTTIAGIPVVLNEMLASNNTLTNADGSTADWVELTNTGTNTINLADLSLTDDPNNPRKYVFRAGSSIPRGGAFLLLCDTSSPASPTNSGFSLSASGGTVLLFNSPTNGGTLLDGVNYGLQTPDFSIGRIPNGTGTWTLNLPTPGAANRAAGLGTAASLSINEWMADPASGADWFELFNRDSQPISLSGLFFTDDLTKKTLSPVPPLSFIGSGASGFVKLIADGTPSAGADHVKFSLSKSGEAIGLYSTTGALIDAITFGQQVTGVSQGRFPDASTNIVSFTSTPSPAESNYLPVSNVVINEVLTHTDPPLEDAIEFYNPTATAVNIGGWFLSNSQDDLKKYRMPDATLVPAFGFKVVYEYQFNPTNGTSIPFTFNSAHGDRAYLSQSDISGNLTGYRAAARFGAAANGVSFGRYTNSIGQIAMIPMPARSFGVDNPTTLAQFRTGTGASNPYPLVGPVVINEIMFYPPPNLTEDNTQDEYVELYNITPYDVALFDPNYPTNTWKVDGGINYTFPANVFLPAGQFLLLVNFDPAVDLAALAEFRSRYSLSLAIPVFGPYGKHLANAGESVALYKPDPPQVAPHPDAGFVPYVLVEQVNYLNNPPWPTGAGGTGSSLRRLTAGLYGDDPINWSVASPTPGQPNSQDPLDTNGDGLPDAWQIQYFGSITSPQAAPGADPDQDGFNNLQEYLAGTSPIDATSRLKIDSVSASGDTAAIHFNAVTGKTYTILFGPSADAPSWFTLTNVPAQPLTAPFTVLDTTRTSSTRFYRLVTPQLP